MLFKSLPALLEIGSDMFTHPLHQAFALDDGEIGDGRRAASRMAGIGVAVKEFDALAVQNFGDLVGNQNTAHRQIA